MKVYNISNARSFFERVLKCTGSVYSLDASGNRTNLKDMAEYCIDSGMAGQMRGIDEMDLSFERDEDLMSLMRFAMQMGREEVSVGA